MFADRLKEIRAEKGITQVQLAEVLSEIFDKRIGYILGNSDDSSSPKLTEEDIDQLGMWAAEDNFKETVIDYLRLDEFGKEAVESLIRAEMARCREQDTLFPEKNFSVSIRLKKEEKDKV